MMAEYIEKATLEKHLKHRLFECAMNNDGMARKVFAECAENRVPGWLSDAPLADVAPVVRCRDCDLWNEWDHAGHESLGNFRCSCAYWSVEDEVTFYTAPTDFCSYGEKRMDGDADA